MSKPIVLIPKTVPKMASITTKGPHLSPITNVDHRKISIETSSEEFKQGEEVGRGGFGVVYKGQWQHTTVAIKKLNLNKMSPEILEEFIKEALLMSQLRHKHIINFYKVCAEPNNYAIIMEYCERGSLYNWLRTTEAENWDIRLRISLEVGKGLTYLHEQKVLHRDLKSLNVLLDKHLEAKITDFGLSKVKVETVSASSSSSVPVGTLRWLPPELLSGKVKHHSEKTDIYAYGMVLWEITTRKKPFHDEPNEAIVSALITQGKKQDIPPTTPPSVAKLIGKCWLERAELRPTAKAAVEELESDINFNSVSHIARVSK